MTEIIQFIAALILCGIGGYLWLVWLYWPMHH